MSDSPSLDAASGKVMANSCILAAAVHKQLADTLKGKRRQEELIKEATMLFFSAKGELIAGDSKAGVTALGRSRRIYVSVRDHPADKDVLERALQGLTMIDTTIYRMKRS